MINKYKQIYGELIVALTELHNAHLDYLEGPNLRKSRDLKKKIKNISPKLKEFTGIVTSVNKEILQRARGVYPLVPNDPNLLTPEFHEWVSKGLGRVNKYTPKGKKK
jgi:hypothetical protein